MKAPEIIILEASYWRSQKRINDLENGDTISLSFGLHRRRCICYEVVSISRGEDKKIYHIQLERKKRFP